MNLLPILILSDKSNREIHKNVYHTPRVLSNFDSGLSAFSAGHYIEGRYNVYTIYKLRTWQDCDKEWWLKETISLCNKPQFKPRKPYSYSEKVWVITIIRYGLSPAL